MKEIGATLAIAVALPACTASPDYVSGANYTYVRGEDIGFKKHYPVDSMTMVGCLQARTSKEYSVGYALDPHAVISILTLTKPGQRIVEAEYLVTRLADGVEVEWRRTRRPYDDGGALTKTAEDLVQGCAIRI